MRIGKWEFELGKRTYVMGILNVTPDSFSDGSVHNSFEKAVNRAKEMLAQGVDIIDVGGESTRPGFVAVNHELELDRVIPVISALNAFNIPISIDTYKPLVAQAAIAAGAVMVNDIWGLKDAQMARVCAENNAVCCIMHNRVDENYTDFLPDLLSDLHNSVQKALTLGVDPNNIIIDPGVGFAKSYDQNLAVLRNFDLIAALGYPTLLGVSRKRVIGDTLNLPVTQRAEGTIATSVVAIAKGCDFIRVHDVLENKRACMMADKILRGV